MNTLKRIVNFLYKDTTGEGESKKLVVVMRLLESIIILYALISGIFCIAHGNMPGFYCFLITILAFIIMFFTSYKFQITTQIFCANLFAYISVVISFFLFGGQTLVQNLLFSLVVLGYFSKYGFYRLKAGYTFVLCLTYLLLQIRSEYYSPVISLHNTDIRFLQVMNILLSFICTGVICYVFSKDSQHLEGKLLEYNTLLKKQASTDPLTGLTNRRSALELIGKLIKNPPEKGFCVCMCDIDFFKKVNDSYGHDIGDNVLRGIAKTMLDGLPTNCLISRWGGEEFLVIFPNMNGDDAKMILDIMRTRLRRLEFRAGEKTFSVTLTFGLAEYGYDGDSDSLVKEADNKLYYGKEHGRDQVVF